MSVPHQLESDLGELCEQVGVEGELHDSEGRVFVRLAAVPLPPGAFQVDVADTLFITDHQYPLSALDMFWTSPEVLLPNGTEPQGADLIESYLGRDWRRFSWHRLGEWRPVGNPLLHHFAMVEARFAMESRRQAVA